MSQDWHLGGRWYANGLDLGLAHGPRSWRIVKEESDGSRWLMQRWSPRLTDKELDQAREVYLQHYISAGCMDPPSGRFGFDDSHVWFLQKLHEGTLAEAWPLWDGACRNAFLQHLQLALDLHPRLLHPEVISIESGRILVPRVIGEAPRSWRDFERSLDQPAGTRPGPRIWEQPHDLSGKMARPIRGRGQELTYLKSLMLGLSSPAPMERIVVLQGEDGMGMGRLGEWSAAVAETESIWVRSFHVQHEEKAGPFLSRLLQALIKGFEADLYAHAPETARILARRLPTFAFLRGGLKPSPEAPVEPKEVDAALKVLEFAAGFHPRMIQICGLEQSGAELQTMLAELVTRSEIAWFLSITLSGPNDQAKELLGPLRQHPAIAFVHLNRLEDRDLMEILEDLLNPNLLGADFRAEVCQASLGNPGLMQSILENAQMEGTLFWQPRKGWLLAEDRPVHIKVPEDLAGKVLAGRLRRLGSSPAAVIRLLAVAEQPLAFSVLGSAIGIAGDPLDDALRSASNSSMIIAKDGRACLSSPRVKDLALDGIPEAEIRRIAKTLLKALGEEDQPMISVHLESIAFDERVALDRVLSMIVQDNVPWPREAEQIVLQTLRLHPTSSQESRLWEFLSDAWAQATIRGKIPADAKAFRSPFEFAMEALDKAKEALLEGEDPGQHFEAMARLLRKEAFLWIRLREPRKATRSVEAAAECLADHPLHPEQPLLRLALGSIHFMQGHTGKGVKALEEGLHLMTAENLPGSHRYQVPLLLELGKAQAHRCQFQRALATLQSALRLMEHEQDYRRLTEVLIALSKTFLVIGQPDAAFGHLREALQTSRIQDDLELQGRCHLTIGIIKSCQQALSSALSHLDIALERFEDIHDRIAVSETKAWKARTLAALGEASECDMLLLQALEAQKDELTAMEWGDMLVLQAEIMAFRGGWRDAARLYHEATRQYEGAGLLWRERMANLRHLQALAQASLLSRNQAGLDQAWSLLEQQKAQVEGSGSRWLDLEWHRAHALLLSTIPDTSEAVTMDSLTALGAMLSAAREMRFPADVLEASTLSAVQLLRRGESLGARSRLQDASSSFQEVWSKVPEPVELSFLGRPDIHQFKETVEAAGMRFQLPERIDPLADWTPTHITLPAMKPL